MNREEGGGGGAICCARACGLGVWPGAWCVRVASSVRLIPVNILEIPIVLIMRYLVDSALSFLVE